MSSLLDASPTSVMEVLRGERASRPSADSSSAASLRAVLEDSLLGVLGTATRTEPVTVRASSFRAPYSSGEGSSALGSLRGILISQALRLLCARVEVTDVYRDALVAWRAEAGENYLSRYLAQLDAEDTARLRADVEAHWVTLRRSLGPLSHWWLPRTSLRAYQRLGAGRVILRDMVDLMVGTTASDAASVVLLDVTTAALDEGAERIMRYHALVQTLRTGTVPLRTSIFSTGTGQLWCSDVSGEALVRSAHEVVDVVRELA